MEDAGILTQRVISLSGISEPGDGVCDKGVSFVYL